MKDVLKQLFTPNPHTCATPGFKAGAATALALAILLCSCGAKPGFELRAASLPGNYYYSSGRTSALPDIRAFHTGLPSETAGRERDVILVEWKAEPGEMLVCGTFRIPARKYCEYVVGLDTYILHDNHSDLEDPRAVVHRYWLAGKLKEIEITPKGLDALPVARAVALGPTEYTAEHGFTFLDWEKGETLTAYGGKESVAKADRIGGVVALGSGFYGGSYEQVAVIADGKVLRFDQAQQKFVEVPDLAWLRAILKNSTTEKPLKAPQRFMFSERVAGMYAREGVLLLSAGGGKRLLRYFRDLDMVVPVLGTRRSPDDIRNNLSDPLALKEEGKHAPPSVISDKARLMPLSDDSIAILDPLYQRIIVVSAPE
jgi:hypothetical protein